MVHARIASLAGRGQTRKPQEQQKVVATKQRKQLLNGKRLGNTYFNKVNISVFSDQVRKLTSRTVMMRHAYKHVYWSIL